MFIHSVYFWEKHDLTAAERAEWEKALRSLLTIDTVRHGWIGTPAPTDRPVIDRTYSYALTLAFDDEKGHDVYQEHPVHDVFRETCARFWREVVIYDSVT